MQLPDKTSFVGRVHELEKINQLASKALAGKFQIGFVVGEAGAGKTTFINKFASDFQIQNPNSVISIGECNAQISESDPYSPFRGILANLLSGMENKMGNFKINRKSKSDFDNLLIYLTEVLIDAGPDLIGSLIPGGVLIASVIKLFATKSNLLEKLKEKVEINNLKSIDINQNTILAQFTKFIKNLSKKYPLLLILDDLHWADTASINMLFHLSRELTDCQVLIIGTYRPNDVAIGRNGDRHPLAPIVNEIKRYFGDVWVDLNQTSELEGLEFIESLLIAEKGALSQGFKVKLLELTGGNALFVVELLRVLQERGDLYRDEKGHLIAVSNINWQNIPPKVEGVIEERISRMEEQLRNALAIASVEGFNFTAEVIAYIQLIEEAKIIDRLSSELEKNNRLIQHFTEIKIKDHLLSVFRFRHFLFQQYIYSGLNPARKRLLHEEVAKALEILYEGQLDNISVQLARHFLEAHNNEKAVHFLIRAGDRAIKISAFLEAKLIYTKAIDISVKNNDIAILKKNLGVANYGLGNLVDAIKLYQDSIALFEILKNNFEVADCQARLGRVLMDLGDYDRAQENLQKSLDILLDFPNSKDLPRVLNELGWVLWCKEKFDLAIKLFTRSHDVALEQSNYIMIAASLNSLGGTYYLLRDYPAAKKYLTKSVEAAKISGNREVHAYSLNNLGYIAYLEKEYLLGLDYLKSALTIAEEIDSAWIKAETLNGLGLILSERRNFISAKHFFIEAINLTNEIKALPLLLFVLVSYARFLMLKEDLNLSLQICALTFSHSATDGEVKFFALNLKEELIEKFQRELFNDLWIKGVNLDLDSVIVGILKTA